MKEILAVDDAPMIIKMLEFALTPKGYKITSASNVSEALEIIKEKSFDMGIFDINMPGENGIELTKKVLATENNKNMKIVILTTESAEDIKQQGKEAGAKGWLQKPFEEEDLLAIVEKLIG